MEKMKRKKVYVALVAVIMTATAVAQTRPMRVESPIVSEKDFVWYTEQKEAWKAETQKDPTNETAWKNYYYAARYMGWWGTSSDSIVRQAIIEMSQAIPDTYTYHYCAHMATQLGYGRDNDDDSHAAKALATRTGEKP